jgi:hypothetical protein
LKTFDGGTHWQPLTDGNNVAWGDTQPVLFMGALALAPSDPKTIYAGTGEANGSGDSFYGRGVLKSTDGGASWILLTGTDKTTGATKQFDRRTIAKIVVDPANANVVYAAIGDEGANGVLNHTGVWKSTDGGATWTNTTLVSNLHIPENVEFSDLVMDSADSQTLCAAVGEPGGNPKNGVYQTTDGGGHWKLLAAAPSGILDGRIALALFHQGATQALYVSISGTGGKRSAPFGQLFKMEKSTDGGATFTDLTPNTPNYMGANGMGQGFYDTTLAASPGDPNIVFAAGSDNGGSTGVIESRDGGKSWQGITADVHGNGPHSDDHAAGFDPAGRLLTGDDGGIFRLDDANFKTLTWTDLNGDLQITQFTGIALFPTNPNLVYGGSQDNGTELIGGTTGFLIAGGDGGFVRVDPSNPTTVYHTFSWPGSPATTLAVPLSASGTSLTVAGTIGFPPTVPFSIVIDGEVMNVTAGAGTKNWTVSRGAAGTKAVAHNAGAPVTLFVNFIERSDDSGATWVTKSVGITASDASDFYPPYVLDPSNASRLVFGTNRVYLTTNRGDSWAPISTPGLNGWTDQFGSAVTAPIDALAVAPTDGNTIYATAGGHVFQTVNGGASWRRIDIPGVADHLADLQVDPSDSSVVYAVRDRFGGGHVFRFAGGQWTPISGNLFDVPVNTLVLDPPHGAIYVGTDNGVYGTNDNGTFWSAVGAGLPSAQVVDLELSPGLNILAAATHGRGLWEMNIPTSLPPPPAAHIARPDACDDLVYAEGVTTQFRVYTPALGLEPATYQWTVTGATPVGPPPFDQPRLSVVMPAAGSSVTVTVTVTRVSDGFQMTDTLSFTTVTLRAALQRLQRCNLHDLGHVTILPPIGHFPPLPDLVVGLPAEGVKELQVGQNADGRFDIFVLGGNNVLYHRLQDASESGWGSWQILGGSFQSFVVAGNADGRQEVVAVGAGNALFHKAQVAPGGVWSGEWGPLGGHDVRQVAVGQNADGRLQIFALDAGNTLHTIAQAAPGSSAWGPSTTLAGPALGQVSVGRNADGRLEVFGLGQDHAVYTISQTAANAARWGSWSRLGESNFQQVGAGRAADGRLEVFALGSDGTVSQKSQATPNGGWSPWSDLGGSDLGLRQLVVGRTDDGRVVLDAAGAGGAFYQNVEAAPNGGWQGWEAVVDESLLAARKAVTASAGRTFTGVVASIADTAMPVAAGDYQASIAWGDGHTSAGVVTANASGGFDVTGSNTYSQAGTYAVRVTVRDREGSVAVANSSAMVAGVGAPQGPAATAGSIALNPFIWTAVGPDQVADGETGAAVAGRVNAIAISPDFDGLHQGHKAMDLAVAGGGVWWPANFDSPAPTWWPLTDYLGIAPSTPYLMKLVRFRREAAGLLGLHENSASGKQ